MHGRSARGALAAVLLLALATSGSGALGPVYGGRITVELAELPARFDPAPARGAGARLIAALVHERLVDLGEGGPRPALAESWETGASGRECSFRLRAGAVFHDGTGIESADVVRSLRRFLRSPSAAAADFAARIEGGAAYRGRATERLPGLTAAGPMLVAVRLRARSATALAALAAADAAITSERGAGAGPFVPTTASPIRGRAAFVPFPGHVRGRPFLDGITVQAAGVAGDGAGRAGGFARPRAGIRSPPSCSSFSTPRMPPSRASSSAVPSPPPSIATISSATSCPAAPPRGRRCLPCCGPAPRGRGPRSVRVPLPAPSRSP